MDKSKKCNLCDNASSYTGDLRTHLKTHSGGKSNKCNQCDYASSQTYDFKTHLKTHRYRVVFLLVLPRKVLNMELVPPKSEKRLSSPKIAISHLKMWKSKSEPVRPYFFAKLQQIGKVWQTLTWTFTFLEEILLSSVNLVIFYYWAGPVSYLQLYWADQSKKPPCSISVEKNTQWR